MAKQGVETHPNGLRALLPRLSLVTFGTATNDMDSLSCLARS